MAVNRIALVVTVGIAVAVAEVSAARAASDYCISLGPPISAGTTYVGKQFKLPMTGKCESWNGFCVGCSLDNVQTGTACTASDGSHVSFQLTTAYLATNRQFDWVRLDLPSETGGGNLNYLLATGTTEYSASGGPCGPASVPVP
jgi:hypothetical protein